MNKLNYPCDKTPNGLCINDGPLCDFDKCKYMNLNQNLDIQRLNEYVERIDAIVHEMKTFITDCSVDTREVTGNSNFGGIKEIKLEAQDMNTDGDIGYLTTYSNQLNTLISEMKLFQKICPKECALSIKFALDGLNAAANEITIAIEELTRR